MNTEETNLELEDAEPKDAEVPSQVAADADATEADVSEADLDQVEEEKQPMTGGGPRPEDAPSAGAEATVEKNGSVKLKIPEDLEEIKFTGLNKEELLKVAGTRGWVRARWTLLVLFWLGWLGTLVGAVLIILQAPRCKDLPVTSWWNDGPLYEIGNIHAFTDTRNLMGVEQKLDGLSELKIKGLVVGPIHVAPADKDMSLSFRDVSPEVGNLQEFKGLVLAAHKKGISVVLDLTPNYQGSSGPWFSSNSVAIVAERLKSALVFWLDEGVDGVQLSGVEQLADVEPSLWADIRAIIQNGTVKRALIGVTNFSSAEDVSALQSSIGVDLLISKVLRPGNTYATENTQTIQLMYSSQSQMKLSWSLGGLTEGHLASLVGPALVKLHQLLLLTLPGTPIINYGDEIGLTDEGTKFPRMLWDSDTDKELNGTLQEERAERLTCRRFFVSVSELRVKERSLLFGDFHLLYNSSSSSSLAYLRVWDQSQRYVVAFNWAEEPEVLQLSNALLPEQATVVLSTNSNILSADTKVDLTNLQLGPRHAVLLKFPYTG